MVLAQEKPVAFEPYEKAQKRPRPRRVANRGRAWLLSLLVFTCASGLALVWTFGQVAVTGYRLTSLQREVAMLEAENGTLEAAVTKLESLDRVERVATTRLGMIQPARDQVLYVAVNAAAAGEGPGNSANAAEPEGTEKNAGRKSGVIQALVELVFHSEKGVSSG